MGDMSSKVYFTDMRTEEDDSLLKKLDRLVRAAGITDLDMDRKFVAVKMHFGEYGNLAFLRANYVRVLSDIIREKGGIPFLTDCSTLYVGMRKNGIEHLDNAELNGFNSVTAGCHVFIGDGLRGDDEIEIPVEGGVYVETAKIGRTIADADIVITLNHFKCHEITGFGGCLKNLGMGCASRRGKMELHASGKPEVDPDVCRGCGKCVKACAHEAIILDDGTAEIVRERCTGCGRCISACPFDAVSVAFDEESAIVNCKIVEYAKAVLAGRPGFHITVVADVTPYCDCHSENDVPIIPNLGLFASTDPVAIDRACVEMAQEQPVIPGSKLHGICGDVKPADIFSTVNPRTRWESHFEHSARIGMGDGRFELVRVG